LDVAFTGSFLLSLIGCPLWFLGSLLKGLEDRVGWRRTVLRMAFPIVTLALVWANNVVQNRIADANAARVIAACEEFRAANGSFPKSLHELVPRYLPSVPRAKYCLVFGNFFYFNNGGHSVLFWCVVPPFGRRTYDFEPRRWSYMDSGRSDNADVGLLEIAEANLARGGSTNCCFSIGVKGLESRAA
jgi:hypothetical protein